MCLFFLIRVGHLPSFVTPLKSINTSLFVCLFVWGNTHITMLCSVQQNKHPLHVLSHMRLYYLRHDWLCNCVMCVCHTYQTFQTGLTGVNKQLKLYNEKYSGLSPNLCWLSVSPKPTEPWCDVWSQLLVTKLPGTACEQHSSGRHCLNVGFFSSMCVSVNILDSLGLHRVENGSHTECAASLHLYSPPFQTCQTFDQRTGHRNTVKMTFWSKYGERTPFVRDFLWLLYIDIQ